MILRSIVPRFTMWLEYATRFQNMELAAMRRQSNAPYLMQGVTTVVTNNDGGGTIAIGTTLDGWTRGGIGTNAALYVPQGSVRRSVMGMSDAPPTAAQLDSMRAIVARGMRDG